MPTLLIRLCGPMQSWGTRSRWSERDTELEPSLSGVMGLLCAARGVPRSEPIPEPWLALRMGVRIDREGTLARDYHTAGGGYPKGRGVARADGGNLDNAVLSNRYYLAGADFLVGLEHEDEAELTAIEGSLRNPRWQLFLGRKSFVPAVPVYSPPRVGSGIRPADARTTLLAEPPWKPTVFATPPPDRARFVFQASGGDARNELRMDQPRADSFASRHFHPRHVLTQFHPLPGGDSDA
jgi:CRISPR system Cascade subunit CasD